MINSSDASSVTLPEADLSRIGAAVTKAETETTGEIVVVLAREVSDYAETPLAWAAGVALILPALAVWLGLDLGLWRHLPAAWTNGLPGAWTAAHGAVAHGAIALAISAFVGVQVAVFLLVYAIVAWGPIRRALTPGWVKRNRTHKAAMAQFLATGLDGSIDRTGVVLFVAFNDHVVEVIADRLIHQAVGAGAWDETVRLMQTGLRRGDIAGGVEAGIAHCGALLAKHFPSSGNANPNTLPDAPRMI